MVPFMEKSLDHGGQEALGIQCPPSGAGAGDAEVGPALGVQCPPSGAGAGDVEVGPGLAPRHCQVGPPWAQLVGRGWGWAALRAGTVHGLFPAAQDQ